MQGGEASAQTDYVNDPSQSIDDIVKIIQEARIEGPKVGGHFFGASMDLDDLDEDADLDDIETSGDFVCALWVQVHIMQANPPTEKAVVDKVFFSGLGESNDPVQRVVPRM